MNFYNCTNFLKETKTQETMLSLKSRTACLASHIYKKITWYIFNILNSQWVITIVLEMKIIYLRITTFRSIFLFFLKETPEEFIEREKNDRI